MEPSANAPLILEHLQPSVLVIVLRLLAGLFMLGTIYVVAILGFFSLNNLHDWHTAYVLFLLLAHLTTYFLITVMVIKLFAGWTGRAYYLSGHHLIERLGLINITQTTYELSQIKSVIVYQSWLARRFNYGTIKLSFAGSGEQQKITMCDITDPMRYKQYIERHLQVQGWVR